MAKALFWIARVLPGVFSPVWNNGDGDPISQTGGISFAQAPGLFAPNDPGIPGAPIYTTAQGSGDARITIQDETPFVLDTTALSQAGYNPGWPGGRWNPATAAGSAVVGIGDTIVDFPTTAGLVQGQEPQIAGKWYFEYLVNVDVFSNRMGVGVGRLGVDLNFWTNSGRFSVTNPYGGVRVSGGFTNQFITSIAANGGPDNPTLSPSVQNTTIGVAVLITDPDAVFRPSGFEPVSLSCAPCAPLVLRSGWPGRFG